MRKLRRSDLEQFRNHDLFQCLTEFIDLVSKVDPVKLKIEAIFTGEYLPAFKEFDDAIEKIEENTFTEAKNIADQRRDRTTRGMLYANKAALYHFNEDIVQAAKHLKILFDSYGNIAVKSQREQTSATTNLLQELNGRFVKDVEATGLGEWVKQLEADNKAYNAIEKKSYAEDAAKNSTKTKDARKKIISVYRSLVDRIEALLLIEETGIYIDFIRQWNAVLEKYDNILAQRQGIAKSKKDKEDER